MEEVQVGNEAEGVAVGQNIRQRVRRTSQNVTVLLDETQQAVQELRSEMLEMSVDIKLLYNMAQERMVMLHNLQNKLDFMGIALLVMALCFAFFVFMSWR